MLGVTREARRVLVLTPSGKKQWLKLVLAQDGVKLRVISPLALRLDTRLESLGSSRPDPFISHDTP